MVEADPCKGLWSHWVKAAGLSGDCTCCRGEIITEMSLSKYIHTPLGGNEVCVGGSGRNSVKTQAREVGSHFLAL